MPISLSLETRFRTNPDLTPSTKSRTSEAWATTSTPMNPRTNHPNHSPSRKHVPGLNRDQRNQRFRHQHHTPSFTIIAITVQNRPTPKITAHHTNHENHSSKTPGSETTETRNPHPTPSQFIISNHRNHSSKNNIPSIHVNSQLAAKLPLERQNSGKTPPNLPEIAARAAS